MHIPNAILSEFDPQPLHWEATFRRQPYGMNLFLMAHEPFFPLILLRD